MRVRLCILLTLGLFAAAHAEAQTVTLTGRVLDAETEAPLSGAHVFVAASTRGTATDNQGRFELRQLPRGAHRIVASMLGYTAETRDVFARTDTSFVLRLRPTVVEVGEVTVTAERDAAWQRRYERFERELLGTTPRAEKTTIENPEVLSFDGTWWGKLTARASAPLVIVNRTLGYRITYVLRTFESTGRTVRWDGEPLYEPLEPASAREARRWARAREEAYRGSLRHFLHTLLDSTTRDAGFITHRLNELPGNGADRWRQSPEALLDDDPAPDRWALAFQGFVEIRYTSERQGLAFCDWEGSIGCDARDSQRSWIELSNGPTLIDPLGSVIDPFGLIVYGHFAFERLADEVPKTYRPP